MILTEVVLPRRVVPQPNPAVCTGGDCGACCIAGVFGISVAEAYGLQDKSSRPESAKDAPVPFSWYTMAHALKCYEIGEALHDGVLDSVPFWPCETSAAQLGHGLHSGLQALAWWEYIRMGLRGGFYGICHVDIDGSGPLSMHNHWVLLCGARQIRVPLETVKGAARIDCELLVSCSAQHPDGTWMNAPQFLEKFGGFNTIMVRPRQARGERKAGE